MFRTVPVSIVRSFFTLHLLPRKLPANLYDIYHCCVYSEKTPYDGQRNCPKHVEFYYKNKFENLVHLVGFIVRIKKIASVNKQSITVRKILNIGVIYEL